MAHGQHCTGTWRKSKLGTKNDGNIRIRAHTSNNITGLHLDTQSEISGTCDGSEQNFSRFDKAANEDVFYKNGKITIGTTTTKIKGKFEKKPKPKDKSVKDRKEAAAGDDWTAEKDT